MLYMVNNKEIVHSSDCMSKQLNAVWRMDVHPEIKQDKWRKIIFLVSGLTTSMVENKTHPISSF